MKNEPSDRAAREIPPVAYLLADHLDSALAAAEDLETAARAWPAHDTAVEHRELLAGERRVIERMRAFEAVLVTRVSRARERARELVRTEAEFATMARLFVGGTASLVDAVAELADASESDFETGDCLVAYLRRRGMIDSEAADLPEGRTIAFDDGFLVAGRIALGPLTEMIIAFMDALELAYDLYPDERDVDVIASSSEVGAAAMVGAAEGPDAQHAVDAATPTEAAPAPATRDSLTRRLRQLDATPPRRGELLS